MTPQSAKAKTQDAIRPGVAQSGLARVPVRARTFLSDRNRRPAAPRMTLWAASEASFGSWAGEHAGSEPLRDGGFGYPNWVTGIGALARFSESLLSTRWSKGL